MKQQSGFTLIELVMVIVILGILAATALPKFADLSDDARVASVNGLLGAVRSAITIVHAQSLIEGEASDATADVVIEGVAVATVLGYPSAAGIENALTFSGFGYDSATGEFTLQTGCTVTYTEATIALGVITPAEAAPDTTSC